MVEAIENPAVDGWDEEVIGGATAAPNVKLAIAPATDCPAGGNTDVNIRIEVPEFAGAKRDPVDIACVIDVSGSM